MPPTSRPAATSPADQAPLHPIAKPAHSAGRLLSLRKNRSQRCSLCGGLGHKSRTCAKQSSLQLSLASRFVVPRLVYTQAIPSPSVAISGPPRSQQAALCLLALSGDEMSPSPASPSSSSVESRANMLAFAPVYPAMTQMMPNIPSPPPVMMSMQTTPHLGMPVAYHYGVSASAPACAAGPFFYEQAMRHMLPPYLASPFVAPHPPASYHHERMFAAPPSYTGMSTMVHAQPAPRLVYFSQPALVPA